MRGFFNWLFFGSKSEVDIYIHENVELDWALTQLGMTKLVGFSYWELGTCDQEILTPYVFLRNEETVRIFNSKEVGFQWGGPFRINRVSFYGRYKNINEKVRLVGSIGWKFRTLISCLWIPLLLFTTSFSMKKDDVPTSQVGVIFLILVLWFLIQYILTTREVAKLRKMLDKIGTPFKSH